MTKILVFTDLQADEGHARLFSDPAMPLQRDRTKSCLDLVHAVYNQHGCSGIWELGDLTDNRVSIPVPTLSIISDWLRRTPHSPSNIKLIGNHEQFTREAQIHTGSLYAGFNVVNQSAVVQVEGVTVLCYAYPATNAYGALAEQVERDFSIHRGKPIIVLGHVDLVGCKTTGGTLLHGLSPSLFKAAKFGLFGHIHKPQVLGKNLHYVGSPFQQNFGEAGEDKRLGLVTIDGTEATLEWLPTDGLFPKYLSVPAAEFQDKFDPGSEDRLEVVTDTQEQTDRFQTHKYAARLRVRQVESTPVASNVSAAGDLAVTPAWGLDVGVQRWVAQKPPESVGLSVSSAELAEFGLCLAAGAK